MAHRDSNPKMPLKEQIKAFFDRFKPKKHSERRRRNTKAREKHVDRRNIHLRKGIVEPTREQQWEEFDAELIKEDKRFMSTFTGGYSWRGGSTCNRMETSPVDPKTGKFYPVYGATRLRRLGMMLDQRSDREVEMTGKTPADYMPTRENHSPIIQPKQKESTYHQILRTPKFSSSGFQLLCFIRCLHSL